MGEIACKTECAYHAAPPPLWSKKNHQGGGTVEGGAQQDGGLFAFRKWAKFFVGSLTARENFSWGGEVQRGGGHGNWGHIGKHNHYCFEKDWKVCSLDGKGRLDFFSTKPQRLQRPVWYVYSNNLRGKMYLAKVCSFAKQE